LHKSKINTRRRADRPGVLFPEGMPIASGSVGFFKSRPNYLPITLLFRDWDLLWIRDGRGRYELAGGVSLAVKPDDFVFLPPFIPIQVIEDEHPLSHYYCHFAFRPTPDMKPNHRKRADFLGPGPAIHVPLKFTAAQAPRVRRAYAAMAKSMTTTDSRPWRIQRALLDVIAELAVFAGAQTQRNAVTRLLTPIAPADDRIASIRRQIDSDPTHPWLVSDLADSVGLTAGHLHALSRKHLGTSLKHYIIDARLRHALRLLKTPTPAGLPSILEVSEACGFSSQHFFSRQFKSRFGLTPLKYRNGAGVES